LPLISQKTNNIKNAFNLDLAFEISKNLSCQNFKVPKLRFIHLPLSKRTFSCPLFKQKCDETNISQILESLHGFSMDVNSPYVNSGIS
jgi:hypothetical protein